MPQRRCRSLVLNSATPVAKIAHAAKTAVHHPRGTTAGASHLVHGPGLMRSARLALSERTAIDDPPPERVYCPGAGPPGTYWIKSPAVARPGSSARPSGQKSDDAAPDQSDFCPDRNRTTLPRISPPAFGEP